MTKWRRVKYYRLCDYHIVHNHNMYFVIVIYLEYNNDNQTNIN
jgi:hypothetical protein